MGGCFLLLLSCDDLLSVKLDRGARATIERGNLIEQLVGDLGLSDFVDMDVTAANELQNEGVKKGDVREVYLDAFVLESEDTPLDFIDEVTVFVEAPGIEKQEIASATDFSGMRVSFAVEDVNLKKYVVSESMTLSAEIDGDRPAEDVQVIATATLDVVATLQGACKAIRN